MIAKIEHTEQQVFYVAGISLRTTNQNGQSAKDIGDLWTKFMTEGIVEKLTDRISDDILCVYTDYESDYTGFYTAVLGCKVTSINDLSEDMDGIAIKAGKYDIYYLEGSFPNNVHEAWVEIWNCSTPRSYTADYDLYSAGAKSFEETEVKIYLAVK
jgi:predicted transcriptional regulator YdeE